MDLSHQKPFELNEKTLHELSDAIKIETSTQIYSNKKNYEAMTQCEILRIAILISGSVGQNCQFDDALNVKQILCNFSGVQKAKRKNDLMSLVEKF